MIDPVKEMEQRERIMLSVIHSLLSGPFAHLQGEPEKLADKAAGITDEIVKRLRSTGNT